MGNKLKGWTLKVLENEDQIESFRVSERLEIPLDGNCAHIAWSEVIGKEVNNWWKRSLELNMVEQRYWILWAENWRIEYWDSDVLNIYTEELNIDKHVLVKHWRIAIEKFEYWETSCLAENHPTFLQEPSLLASLQRLD